MSGRVTTVSETPTQAGSYVPSDPARQAGGGPPPRVDGEGGGIGDPWWHRHPSLRIAALIAIAAIAALVVWLVFLRSDGESATAKPGGGPVGATQADLAALSTRLGQPIYWAGIRSGTDLEATVTSNDYVYVRYLTPGAQVGDSSPQFLTVATYPATDALGNLRSYAKHEHATITHIAGGGIAVPVPGATTSVYFATPGSDYQVEVFEPREGQALDLIKSGTIEPVPGGVNGSGPPAPGPIGG